MGVLLLPKEWKKERITLETFEIRSLVWQNQRESETFKRQEIMDGFVFENFMNMNDFEADKAQG